MNKRLTEDDGYYKILRDFQIFVQQYYSFQSEDEMTEVIAAAGKTFGKYKNTEFFDFAMDLLNAHLKDMERRKNG